MSMNIIDAMQAAAKGAKVRDVDWCSIHVRLYHGTGRFAYFDNNTDTLIEFFEPCLDDFTAEWEVVPEEAQPPSGTLRFTEAKREPTAITTMVGEKQEQDK